MSLRDVQWVVLTPDRLPSGNSWVIFGLDPRDYEALALNMADILRWIREARWRLRYYKGEIDGLGDQGPDR